jgi:hypothetical protein
MAAVRTEAKPCRWCGRTAVFAVQYVIGGPAELVTDAKCIAAARVLVGAPCEAISIDIAHRAKKSRPRRGRK